MNVEEEYDWFGFSVNFVIGALPTFFVSGMLVWRYSPYTEGNTVLLISCISSAVVGLASGIWKAGFWSLVSEITSLSPYSRKHK